MFLSRLPLRGAAGIPGGQGRQSPVRLPLVFPEGGRRPAWVEGVREADHWLQVEGGIGCRLAEEPGDGLGDDPALLGQGPPLHEHGEVQLLGGEAL
jgi:hypothetical protein